MDLAHLLQSSHALLIVWCFCLPECVFPLGTGFLAFAKGNETEAKVAQLPWQACPVASPVWERVAKVGPNLVSDGWRLPHPPSSALAGAQ